MSTTKHIAARAVRAVSFILLSIVFIGLCFVLFLPGLPGFLYISGRKYADLKLSDFEAYDCIYEADAGVRVDAGAYSFILPQGGIHSSVTDKVHSYEPEHGTYTLVYTEKALDTSVSLSDYASARHAQVIRRTLQAEGKSVPDNLYDFSELIYSVDRSDFDLTDAELTEYYVAVTMTKNKYSRAYNFLDGDAYYYHARNIRGLVRIVGRQVEFEFAHESDLTRSYQMIFSEFGSADMSEIFKIINSVDIHAAA